MSEETEQFGEEPRDGYNNRPGSYGVIFNNEKKILVLEVRSKLYLPGGGIDEGEEPEAALVREIEEEAGCRVTSIKFIGKANQFFPESEEGPINKLGTFYKGFFESVDKSKIIEDDHETRWLPPEEFIKGPSREFQVWAVKKALESNI